MVSYEPLPHLTPVRRLVTGHDGNGKAIFQSDDRIAPVGVSNSRDGTGFTLIHRTKGFPVTNQGTDDELGLDNLQRSKFPTGIVCELVDVPPGTTGAPPPHFHRNHSLDYGVILDGTINLILDEGKEQTLQKGDVFVQRGTMHAWRNPSDRVCRFMTVIVPAQKIVLESTGEVLDAVKVQGLTD